MCMPMGAKGCEDKSRVKREKLAMVHDLSIAAVQLSAGRNALLRAGRCQTVSGTISGAEASCTDKRLPCASLCKLCKADSHWAASQSAVPPNKWPAALW